jgi:hypothetical protein
MVEHRWGFADRGTPEEAAALASRLQFAAQSLALEYPELSPAAAERLIFAVAREFLSSAQVAQFVPTLATRRARQLLRHRGVEVVIPDAWIEDENSSVVDRASAREPAPAPALAPPRPPAFYAVEAKRLLAKAKELRATTLLAVGSED